MTSSTLKPIDRLLTELVEENASDLHIHPGHPPRMRKDGNLVNLRSYGKLDSEDVEEFISEVSPDFDSESSVSDDFAYEVSGVGRFRGTHFMIQPNSRDLVLRLIPESVRTLQSIAAPRELRDFAQLEKGLVLITGSTGSGRTTTCHALLDAINKTRSVVIATVEYAGEYTQVPKKAIFSRNKGDYLNLNSAEFLQKVRETSPDVIYIEHISSAEVFQEALLAAKDCLVIAGDANVSPAKVIRNSLFLCDQKDLESHRKLFAENLAGISTQRLVINPSGEGRHAEFDVIVPDDSLRKKILDYDRSEDFKF